jgi:putative ABC transport system permease protein
LTRAREIGVRKVTGAARWQIFTQFISEAVIVALLALVLAFLLLMAIKPLMLRLSFARMMNWDLEGNYFVYALFFAFAVATGILAGVFPAVVMSGFQPVKVLKGLNTMKLFSKMGLRKILLITQFSFSLIFILSVITVFSQLKLFMVADHGFEMKNKMIVYLNGSSSENLKNELSKFSNIQNATAVSHIPAAGTQYGDGFKRSLDEKDWTEIYYFSVDPDYQQNLGLTLVAGNFFDNTNAGSNKNFIVLNEKAIEAFHLGSPREAIGQELIARRDSSKLQIIGVVKNYNHQMLMEKLDPMALVVHPDQYNLLQVKYSGSYGDAQHSVEQAWAKVNPSLKVDYRDFELEVHKLYDIFFGDLTNILAIVSALAIIISCLGLLGMATYSIETRIKEVSIRKVLGSSDRAIVYLLSKGFVLILLLSIVIAVPSAFLLNNLWLEKLAYHVTLSPLMVLTGVCILMVFAGLTIGSQTLRAANTSPVQNLKE